MNQDIKVQFHRMMMVIYERTKSECNYNATRFLEMVNRYGGLEAAKALLHSPGSQEGLIALWHCGRLDISMEATILKSPWNNLFTEEELEIAKKRLHELGYNSQA
ncbi:MAG: hypothetical protein JRJ29_11530 [Deltaproteobacteria bacterium]|nr:hypothetical protein [Deltaproteobacteria bacterium]